MLADLDVPPNSALDGLNPEQSLAVRTLEGPLLVLAGAGTGKTRVLTARIAYIVAQGLARPHQILAVTFTNKAAQEMKARVLKMVGPLGEGMAWLGTFHAIGTKILRRHPGLFGLEPHFTILNTEDQIRLLKQMMKAEGVDEKKYPAKIMASLIDMWKNKGLSPSQISCHASSFANGKASTLYQIYQERLKILNAADFGDLLLGPLLIFQKNPDILENYQKLFRFILVDEYQDTNIVQHMWLKALAKGHSQICCVGDDDQSIYGWRGAEVDNILKFETDFPGARIIRLERNYRSTGHILGAASGLIAHNQSRLGKELFPDGKEMGERIILTQTRDAEEEARLIGEDVERFQRQGHGLHHMAILVRASFQMRAFEERFIAIGIPYRVIGGPRFYERAEIRDAIAYLRCTAQPSDDLAFERILNVPKRGLGDATLQILHHCAREKNLPLFQAARFLIETQEIKPKQRQALRLLLSQLAHWIDIKETISLSELTSLILEESGYIDMWKNDVTPEAPGRVENLKELRDSMGDFPDLNAFLEHVALVLEATQEKGGEQVTIMTLHAAKGLEFEIVFLPGWEEGIFPHQRALDEHGNIGLEEERRLAYVGLTRARKKAKISYTSFRHVYGKFQLSLPSRFLGELPQEHIEICEAGLPFSHAFAPLPPSPSFKKSPYVIEGKVLARQLQPGQYQEGARILHIKFGPGTVRHVEGSKLTIDFDHAGEKIVLDSFVTSHTPHG